MGLHFYDSSTDSFETQKVRLQPASAISQAGIPCVVWAEDALSFVYFVPTSLFTLQLFVPDESVEAAAQAVTTLLPYQRMSTPMPHLTEYSFIDSDKPNCFPNSILLELCTPKDRKSDDDSETVLIHPQSYFSFAVSNHDLSVSLDGFPSSIHFPTRTAFLDSIITTILDPPLGFRHQKLEHSLMCYLGYFITYTLRNQPRVQPSGDLEAEHASVLANLKEENRTFFENFIRNTSKGWSTEVQARREILERLG